MKRITVMIKFKKEDAEFIAKAIEHYQKELGIKKYQLRCGINGLRMTFEDISQMTLEDIKQHQKQNIN